MRRRTAGDLWDTGLHILTRRGLGIMLGLGHRRFRGTGRGLGDIRGKLSTVGWRGIKMNICGC